MKDYNSEYYQKHRNEHILAHQEYYKKNKELINEKRRSRIWCEACQLEITRSYKSRHIKTKSHLANIKLLNRATV